VPGDDASNDAGAELEVTATKLVALGALVEPAEAPRP